MRLFQACPGSRRIKQPYPEELTCLCGKIAEIWSDEASAICKHCKRELTREVVPSCLDWCSIAKECMGEERFKKYLQSKKQRKRGSLR